LEAELSKAKEASVAIEEEVRRADALRQSILKAAFAGKLVPQDENDEPASVLLERIRAEHAARPEFAVSGHI
jgi:type I restriction enzyme S subunit